MMIKRGCWALILALAGVGLSGITLGSPAATAAAPSPVQNPAALVNPFVGTAGDISASGGGGDNNNFPGPDVPFGMVQWGPDTSPHRQQGGGYKYNDSQILGFSLDHLEGPGCGVFGDVPILPTVGAVSGDPQATTETFSHAHESASADYYQVDLNPGTTSATSTELTSATRSAIGRFTFPATTLANFLFKLSDSENGVAGDSAQLVGDNGIEGSVTSGWFCYGPAHYTVYFSVTFDQPFRASGTWTRSPSGSGVLLNPGGTKVQFSPAGGFIKQVASTTADNGIYVTFDTTANPVVQAKVGISWVSIDNAALNANTDQAGWNFDQVHSSGVKAWNQLLSRIEIGGGTATEEQLFYTLLYQSLLHPNVFSDVNGQYMGFDNQVHTVPSGHAQYANYSGWDTYRSQAQLEALIDPQVASDSAQSMVNDASQNGGMLPKWPVANGEDYVMVGDPGEGILAGTYAFGARNFDTRAALAYAIEDQTTQTNITPGLSYYKQLGYLPSDGTYGCCTYTLGYAVVSTAEEYGAADFALSQFAQALGDTTDGQKFEARSQAWQNLFDATNAGFLQPKMANGQFGPFDPATQSNYTEGNASQYRFMVPWNLHGLVAAMGGADEVNSLLDEFWTKLNDGPSSPYSFWDNQFEYSYPWDYDFTGEPYKTQELVNRVRTQLYADAPVGMGDNNDLGATASMGVFSMLGFFPMYIGNANVVLNSPLFPLEVIQLADGKTVRVTASNASPGDPYVQSLTFDSRKYTKPWLPASVFTHGATLDFTLASTPNPAWGADPADAPPSYSAGEAPALTFTDPTSELTMGTPATATVELGVRNLSDTAQTVAWTASAAPYHNGTPAVGLPTVTPASGSVTLAPGAAASQAVTVSTTAAGLFSLSFDATAAGQSLPATVLEVQAAPGSPTIGQPGPLDPYFNNGAVAEDGNPATLADYDFHGASVTNALAGGIPAGLFQAADAYSMEALAAAGITPGASIAAGGMTYTWPNVAPGEPDNIVAAGQTIPLAHLSGQGELGVLGTATNAPKGAEGSALVTYTDGSQQTFELGLSDWTLGGGANHPAYGNTIAATLRYQESQVQGCTPAVWIGANGTSTSASPGCGAVTTVNPTTTYLFSAVVPVNPSKTLASITLPTTTTGGQLHIFALATSTGTPATKVPEPESLPAWRGLVTGLPNTASRDRGGVLNWQWLALFSASLTAWRWKRGQRLRSR